MPEREDVEREVRRATARYLADSHGSDEDLHPERLDPEGRALEEALDRLERWKRSRRAEGLGGVDDLAEPR